MESLMAEGEGADELDIQKLKADSGDTGNPELSMDGETLSLPQELEELLSSILQDFDEIPEDWLDQAGNDVYDPDGNHSAEDTGETRVSKDTNALYYDEWDFRRQTYRKNWCALKEHDAQ